MGRREDYAGNENRAKHSASINPPSPCSSEYRAPSPNEQPPSIRGDAPMTLDPHKNFRHSIDNAERKPGEKSRAAESAETRRRLANPGKPTDTYR
jgi:hypothetical protein